MKVLVICPTYARLPYLGRMMASFLSQTYTNSDLVLINDDPNVRIKFEHERVTIINTNKKILLDHKRNIGAVFGQNYDIIMPFDDDDVFLPKQLEYHVSEFNKDPNIEVFFNDKAYIVYGDKFMVSRSTPNNIAYRPDVFMKVGGYSQFDNNQGGDMVFFSKLSNKKIVQDLDNIYFVYNFGGVNYHLSCMGDNEQRLETIANSQRDILNCGSEFNIVPDFEEYEKFKILSQRMMDTNNEPIQIKHLTDAKIEI